VKTSPFVLVPNLVQYKFFGEGDSSGGVSKVIPAIDITLVVEIIDIFEVTQSLKILKPDLLLFLSFLQDHPHYNYVNQIVFKSN
jgi:hypothetical protein